jgi:SpoVK/Ycf46/Vps4 family AAA+-type ATPase
MKKRIMNYCKAGFPILRIQTTEEAKALRAAKEASDELSRGCFVFSITAGMINLSTGAADKSIDDPIKALGFVRSATPKNVFVFLDPGEWVKDGFFRRTLKDLVSVLRSGNPIIFVSPGFDKCEDIDFLVNSITPSLPTPDEIKKIIGDITPEEIVKHADIDNVVRSCSGMSEDEVSDSISLSLVESKDLSPSIIMREKISSLGKRDYMNLIENEISMKDIGGLEVLKEWIGKRRMAFSKEAKEFGLPSPKGVLLTGIPGCGKSLAAKAFGAVLGVPVLQLNIGSLMSQWVGSSENNMREAIRIAEAMSPIVLWLDEIDKQIGGAGDSHEVTKRLMSFLLTWLEEKKSEVFVVATANNVEALAGAFPELLRKGRWDEIFFVDTPNDAERRAIFEIHISKFKRNPKDFSIATLASESAGFSGAEIAASVRDAMFDAYEDGEELATEYILNSVKNTTPISKFSSDTIERVRAWAASRTRKASASDVSVKYKRNVEM